VQEVKWLMRELTLISPDSWQRCPRATPHCRCLPTQKGVGLGRLKDAGYRGCYCAGGSTSDSYCTCCDILGAREKILRCVSDRGGCFTVRGDGAGEGSATARTARLPGFTVSKCLGAICVCGNGPRYRITTSQARPLEVVNDQKLQSLGFWGAVAFADLELPAPLT